MNAGDIAQQLAYDPATGEFTRLATKGGSRVGSKVGSRHGEGYVTVCVGGRSFLAHRVAWLLMTGEWPTQDIDHINGNRSDNRWSNLRSADRSQNMQNRRVASARSKSGLLGVHLHRPGRWAAQIRANGRNLHLGLFDSPEEAHQAYLKAKGCLHAYAPREVV